MLGFFEGYKPVEEYHVNTNGKSVLHSEALKEKSKKTTSRGGNQSPNRRVGQSEGLQLYFFTRLRGWFHGLFHAGVLNRLRPNGEKLRESRHLITGVEVSQNTFIFNVYYSLIRANQKLFISNRYNENVYPDIQFDVLSSCAARTQCQDVGPRRAGRQCDPTPGLTDCGRWRFPKQSFLAFYFHDKCAAQISRLDFNKLSCVLNYFTLAQLIGTEGH